MGRQADSELSERDEVQGSLVPMDQLVEGMLAIVPLAPIEGPVRCNLGAIERHVLPLLSMVNCCSKLGIV